MDQIVTFLRARLDEDEAVAKAAVSFDYGVKDWADDGDPTNVHIARHDPARVLREVAAIRAILAAFDRAPDWSTGEDIRILATAYSDHPDYRDEWAPTT